MYVVKKVERGKLFSVCHNTRTQGHPSETSARSRTGEGKVVAPCAAVQLWSLPLQDGLTVHSTDSFKRGLDSFVEVKAVNGC